MNKNLMLFVWFLKFGLIKPRDEYNMHDYIKAKFCPEYFPAEDFDEKEQLLRDTPGPAGIKYAAYVGGKINGTIGVCVSVAALFIPVIAAAAALYFVYNNLFYSGAGSFVNSAVRGMHAAALGLIIAHLIKIVYFNKTGAKSLSVIIPSAFIFIFLSDITGIGNHILMPFYIIAVVIFGVIFGIIHVKLLEYREKNPSKKYIDPYSRKGKKLRERQLREEEYALRKYIDDDTIKKRRQQLEEEAAKKRKYRGEE
ncbi:MAG: chromate transporter [Oscillospiraceae bacterium]|nr:chromate transporter [Oscillospiraceae bacterium]